MLTPRQRQIWDFLVDYGDRHGYPPTVREIGEAVGLASPSTVHAHLANLERVGLIKRDPTKPRALELRRAPKPQPGSATRAGRPRPAPAATRPRRARPRARGAGSRARRGGRDPRGRAPAGGPERRGLPRGARATRARGRG